MKNQLSILFAVILIACNSSTMNEDSQVNAKTEEVLEELSAKKEVNHDTLEVLKKKRNHESIKKESNNRDIVQFDESWLIGIWAIDEESDADFFIEGDSVFFVRHLEKGYFYEIKESRLIFHFDGFKTVNKILKLTKDSLHIVNDVSGETTRLYNRNSTHTDTNL